MNCHPHSSAAINACECAAICGMLYSTAITMRVGSTTLCGTPSFKSLRFHCVLSIIATTIGSQRLRTVIGPKCGLPWTHMISSVARYTLLPLAFQEATHPVRKEDERQPAVNEDVKVWGEKERNAKHLDTHVCLSSKWGRCTRTCPLPLKVISFITYWVPSCDVTVSCKIINAKFFSHQCQWSEWLLCWYVSETAVPAAININRSGSPLENCCTHARFSLALVAFLQ